MKKLLHSLTGALLAAAAIAPQAQAAITIDEITQWGGNAIEVFYGDLNQGGVILWTNATPVIKKVSDSQFKIEGICDGDYDLTVNYNSSNEALSIPDGRALVARNASWDGNVNGLSNSYAYNRNYGWFYYYSDASTTGKVQKVDDDLYLITINKCEFGMSDTMAPQFEAIQIWVFRTNSNVEDYVGTSTTPRNYKALVAANGDGFKIYNFANRGFGYKVSFNSTTASNSSLQAMEGYLMDDGLVSIKTNYANSLNQEYVMRNSYGNFTNYSNVQTWSWFGTPEGDYSDIRSEIAGTYHHDNPSHVNDDETHWVSHNGKCRTYAQLVMELTPYAMFRVNANNEYYYVQWGSIVYNTVYTIDESDVTHSVEMSMHDRGYAVTPKIGTYVKGHVTPVKTNSMLTIMSCIS